MKTIKAKNGKAGSAAINPKAAPTAKIDIKVNPPQIENKAFLNDLSLLFDQRTTRLMPETKAAKFLNMDTGGLAALRSVGKAPDHFQVGALVFYSKTACRVWHRDVLRAVGDADGVCSIFLNLERALKQQADLSAPGSSHAKSVHDGRPAIDPVWYMPAETQQNEHMTVEEARDVHDRLIKSLRSIDSEPALLELADSIDGCTPQDQCRKTFCPLCNRANGHKRRVMFKPISTRTITICPAVQPPSQKEGKL